MAIEGFRESEKIVLGLKYFSSLHLYLMAHFREREVLSLLSLGDVKDRLLLNGLKEV